MFKKPKLTKPRPLSSRITRPCYSLCVDELSQTDNGSHEIRQVDKPRVPEQFRDLGDAECYGIAYLQTKGVELKPVEGQSRVTPMEAINIAESAINNIHVPTNEN